MAEISIWLDTYDDIFSDFDPRPYSKRTVSDDFILQVRKVLKNRYEQTMVLKLLLPAPTRNQQNEAVVANRIHEYFNIHHERLALEKRNNIRKGVMFTISGFLLMLLASYLSFIKSDSFLKHALFVLFEPTGWFMLWMGMDEILNYSGKIRKELQFYLHMTNVKIEFESLQ